jgi:hypothetical protein
MKNIVRTDTPLDALLTKYCQNLEAKNYSAFTVRVQRIHLSYFNTWAAERGITEPVEVTRVSLVSCPGDFVSANSTGWIGVGPT